MLVGCFGWLVDWRIF